MKKHVLLGLSLMLLCFITGGVYIVGSFQSGSEKLQRVITLHQVELLRKNLQHDIEIVQTGLLLQGSPHTDNTIIIQHIEKMEVSAAICQSCHHIPEIKEKLDRMQSNLAGYMKLYSRALTIWANSSRVEYARNQAYKKGEQLLQEVELLSVASAGRISTRINTIHAEIRAASNLLIACLVFGPIAILVITLFFLRRFTGSFNILMVAAGKLAEGDFNYRITAPLKDEFAVLAAAFNSMVDSINAEQHATASARTLYQTLFESAGDAICILDTGDSLGQIISVNPAASRMYGYSNDELQTMNCVELSPEEEHEIFRQKMLQVVQGEWINCTVTRTRKDGQQFLAAISGGPLEIDQHSYILTFARDVTEQHQAQQEMQRANQMALVGEMAAGLAHEIKNPLAGIKVSLDVISDELDLPVEDREIFVRIIHEIDHMERLLKSLLKYARPPVPHFDLVDINLLLEYSIKTVAFTADNTTAKQILFEKDCAAELPQIEADSSQLQQVLLNIYLNAIDAMDNGGIITTVSRKADPHHVRIEISDTGKGLSESSLEKIFNPFFTTKAKGSGLGLSICKRLIEQHKGTIEAQSRPGAGTSFIIILPLTQTDKEKAAC
ncbi:MAG: ATP-binding protein [Desulfuromonadaceae bacterium]|nr:ATP-binding protein [Desulfuromonadaceae bacterium]